MTTISPHLSSLQVLFVINCYINAILSFVYFGQLFMTLTPPHWCSAPDELLESDLDLTPEQVKELTVPKDEVTGKFAECKMYQVNITQVSVESNTVSQFST